MLYAGEKPPRTWWDEFEIRLTNAFAIIDKDARRQVHTDEMKLRLLNKKIRADSQNICVSIISVILLDWEFGTSGGGPIILFRSHQICRCLTFIFSFHKMNTFSLNGMPSFYTITSTNLPNGGLALFLFQAVIGLDFPKVTWANDHCNRKVSR